MKEVDELFGKSRTMSEGIDRELCGQADQYMEIARLREASSSGNDGTSAIRRALRECAGYDNDIYDSKDRQVTEVTVSDFLKELAKENSVLSTKLKPLLSWVDSIGVNGEDIEFRYDRHGGDCKGKPQWLREGVLAADIQTHGVFIPKVLRCRFVEQDGVTRLVGLKGLEISTTVLDVPIRIDRIAVQSLRFSLSGDRLRLDVEAKNPAPFLSKILPAHKRRPNPIPSVVLVDDEGKLEMYETWRK